MNNTALPAIEDLLYDALILRTKENISQPRSHHTFYFADRDKAEAFASAFEGKKFEVRKAADGGFRIEAIDLRDIKFSKMIDRMLETKRHLRVFSDYATLSLYQKVRMNEGLKSLLPHVVVYEQLPGAKGREGLEYFLYFADSAERDSFYQALKNITPVSETEMQCRTDNTHVEDKTYYTIYIRNQNLAQALEGIIPRKQILPVTRCSGGANLGALPMSHAAVEILGRVLDDRQQSARA